MSVSIPTGIADYRQQVMQDAGLDQAEYDKLWAESVAFVARSQAQITRAKALHQSPSLRSDDTDPQNPSSSIEPKQP
jgi:hypothetical protein